MKRNDFATFVVYLAMFGVAIAVGLAVIAPTIKAAGMSTSTSLATVFIAVVAALFFFSVTWELLHVLGAKIGKCEVISVAILGLTFKKVDGKRKVTFASFNGLTGETKVKPLDVENSSVNSMIFLPMFAFLLEVIICVVLLIIFKELYWLKVGIQVFLAVGGMIFVYNDFPAHLDSETDGFRLVLLSNVDNKVVYNTFLAQGGDFEKLPNDLPTFEKITPFASELNLVKAYRLADEGKYDEAIAVVDLSLNTEKKLSESLRNENLCFKLSLVLLQEKKDEAKTIYEGLSDGQRKHIAGLTSLTTVRCYALISALLDNEEGETNFALDKAGRLLKKTDKNIAPVEKKLTDESYQLIKRIHPEWDINSNYFFD